MDIVCVEELNGEDYLYRANCEFPDHFEKSTCGFKQDLKVVYESEREDWKQRMVVAGMGCCVMPKFLRKKLVPDREPSDGYEDFLKT